MACETAPKFVYFDVGNVLLKFEGGFEAISKKYNIPLKEVVSFENEYEPEISRGNMSRQDWYEKLMNKFGVNYDKKFDFES